MQFWSIQSRLFIVLSLNIVQLTSNAVHTSTAEIQDFTPFITTIAAQSEGVDLPQIAEPQTVNTTTADTTHTKTIPLSKPDVVSINIPFFAQAPLADWSAPFQEACEEISVLLVQSYLENLTWTAEQMNEEVKRFTGWVESNGYKESVTLEELADIVHGYTDLQATVVYDPTIQMMENLLDSGYPIIVPAAGRELQNPYFTGEGPLYHMLVVTGYNETHFITKEVGTQYGDNYQYEKSHLLESIHNLTPDPEQISQGAKAVLLMGTLK